MVTVLGPSSEIIATGGSVTTGGPDPSLTPEQRYGWAYDRLMEAYGCASWNRQRALLLTIVKKPVEDKQLMTAEYATLSGVELSWQAQDGEIKAVEDGRDIQFSILRLQLGDAVGLASRMVDQADFFHHPVDRPLTGDGDAPGCFSSSAWYIRFRP